MYLSCIIIQCICDLMKFIHISFALIIFEKELTNSHIAALLSDMLSEYFNLDSKASSLNRILSILFRADSLMYCFYEDPF
jgi:hypothetical protein